MSKIVDITNKLSFEDNPKLVIKGIELEIDTSAETMIKIMALTSGDVTVEAIAEMSKLLFTAESYQKMLLLKLNFSDFKSLVSYAIRIASGKDLDDDENSGETPTPTMM